MKKADKIKRILTIFDIVIILLISAVLFFSAFSYYNSSVKSEIYMRNFLISLKAIYILGIIAISHMIFSVIYTIHLKMKKKR